MTRERAELLARSLTASTGHTYEVAITTVAAAKGGRVLHDQPYYVKRAR